MTDLVKISELPAAIAPAGSDVVLLNEAAASPTSRQMRLDQIPLTPGQIAIVSAPPGVPALPDSILFADADDADATKAADLAAVNAILDHDALTGYVAAEHTPLDDAATTAGNVWSASKISAEIAATSAPVASVFGRVGAVLAVSGDYSAALVSFSPDGDIAATDAQAAIVEVRDDADTKIAAITFGTLAELNALVTDATLDDASDPRPPTGAAGGDLAGTYPSPSVINGADGSAIHDDTAGEIAAVAVKATPIAADLLLIEDSAAGNAKKRITVGSLPAGGGGQTDTVAGATGITNTGDNVNAVLEPTYGTTANTITEGNDARLSDARTPTGAAGGDLAGTYPSPSVVDGADGSAIHDDTAGEIAAVAVKATPIAADLLLIEDSAAGNAKKRITVGSLPAGGGALDTGSVIHVDASYGDDGTGQADRADLPFATVAAALAVAGAGDAVKVRPGVYAESGLTIPTGAALIGDHWMTTTIGDVSALADIIAISDGAALIGVTVQVPAGAFAGVTHTTGTGAIRGVNFVGDGATGAGDGIHKSGAGKLIGGSLRVEGGGLSSAFRCSAGVLALDDTHIPQSAGTIAAGIRAESSGRYQGQGHNCGSTNITDAIRLDGAASVVLYSPNVFNAGVAVHIAADGISYTSTGGRYAGNTLSVLVDPALSGTGTIVRVMSTVIDPLFSFPPAAAQNVDFVVDFNQESTSLRDPRRRLIGADQALGFPELGSGFSVGRGEPYSAGIKVVTSDATATGGLVDVTAAAASRSASVFSFQGLAAGHAIYFASARLDAASNPFRHWGLLLDQVGAGVGGAYVVEYWDGAAWAAADTMAISVDEQHLYASALFLRAGSLEDLHYGISGATPWATTTIDGLAAYWTRIRVTSPLTTAPTWERVRLHESASATNRLGQQSRRGLAQWRAEIFGVGNVWAEVAGAADATISVGVGGQPTGWNHKIKKGLLNTNGDAASWQAQIPPGLNTAHPLYFTLTYSLIGGQPLVTPPDLILSLLCLRTQGVLVADPAGGVTPIPRPLADAEQFDSKAAEALTLNPPAGTVDNRPLRLTFGPFSIADYYPGDSLVLAVELDSSGSPTQDAVLWSLTVEGVQFTEGSRFV